MITENRRDCSGCSACMSICQHNAIEMRADTLGFLYPRIDETKCVKCGLCLKACSFNDFYEDSCELNPIITYAARHKNVNEIITSRSGAVFIALSDWVLLQGGVVYGVGYDRQFRVIHKRAISKMERDEFKGSKYSQSDIGNAFKNVSSDLRKGEIVLFSGTPCQVSGLKKYLSLLRIDTAKLYLVDIICHGVASPAIWRDYLNYLEKTEKKRLIKVDFRDKSIFGWDGLHKESFTYENNIKKTYSYTYYSDLIIRPSCNNCPYTNLKRPSDITIGDCWGIEKISNEFNKDGRGVSLVLCNSEKGASLMSRVYDVLDVLEVDITQCLQPNLCRPTPRHSLCDDFETDYKNRGFVYVRNKYGNVGIKNFIKRIIRYLKRLYK